MENNYEWHTVRTSWNVYKRGRGFLLETYTSTTSIDVNHKEVRNIDNYNNGQKNAPLLSH